MRQTNPPLPPSPIPPTNDQGPMTNDDEPNEPTAPSPMTRNQGLMTMRQTNPSTPPPLRICKTNPTPPSLQNEPNFASHLRPPACFPTKRTQRLPIFPLLPQSPPDNPEDFPPWLKRRSKVPPVPSPAESLFRLQSAAAAPPAEDSPPFGVRRDFAALSSEIPSCPHETGEPRRFSLPDSCPHGILHSLGGGHPLASGWLR